MVSSSNELLRRGFRLAHRHIDSLFLDLLWKFVWLVLTAAGFLGIVVWFGSEFRSIAWVDTGNRAINTAVAVRILREFWVENWPAIFVSVALVCGLSTAAWFFLEAEFRSRFFSGVRGQFSTFLLSNVLKCSLIAGAALAFGAICFARFFTIPFAEWPQFWPDARGGVFVSIITIGALGFALTILDTLVRRGALELLGTDLFRVTGLIAILLSFEAMIVSTCVVALAAGLLNVADLKSALEMLAAIAVAACFMNVVHSYLLLVRYSAVDIMRENVIEV